MTRGSNVALEDVRRAAFEILSRGERPTRPTVQELLATQEHLGRKGSNAVVQRLLNQFWAEPPDASESGRRRAPCFPACFG
ncbi:MAG: DNA-binding protein [Azoarcus sp.]|nr:DNA-binding protein [Azoarcus sp.]